MIVKELFRTRKDGVKLYLTMDVAVDENGNALRDEKGALVPSGHQIKQVETNRYYNSAIDVEFAPYHYRATTVPIVVRERKARNNG
jgi:hypothetical protein